MNSYSDEDEDDDSIQRGQDQDDLEEYDNRLQQREVPESEYNEGLGIKYIVTFQPKHPPIKAGQKRRKGTKLPPKLNSTFHLHEQSPIAEMIDSAIKCVNLDERTLRYKIIGGDLRTNKFSITWTLRGTDFKDMQLRSDTHYNNLKKETVDAHPDKPTVKLLITETESAGVGDDTENENDEGNATATHIRLTPLHLATWAAAILAKQANVDVQNPPPPEKEKMFWPTEQQADIDDIAQLAARRRQVSNKPASTPSITVNNDFSGLAALFKPLLPSSAPHNPPMSPRTPNIARPRAPPSPEKPAMTIAEFCTAFRLPAAIVEGLRPLQLDGPHLLEHLENSILDTYLPIGQRLSLRYAEAQWKKGKVLE
ncbi:hypothetical protein DFH09DRAFT_1319504 [Mycena vulgaris]|nr:hypothetical protein DFH09DRAFT_1319504 [Mycena vulgaris]